MIDTLSMIACSNEQHSIDHAVVLGLIGDLRVLAPDDLAALGDETELADVHLDDGTFGHDAERREQCRARVLLDANDWQAEGGLQLRMSHVRFRVAQRHWSNEALEFGRLAREILADEAGLGHHSLPRFSFCFEIVFVVKK